MEIDHWSGNFPQFSILLGNSSLLESFFDVPKCWKWELFLDIFLERFPFFRLHVFRLFLKDFNSNQIHVLFHEFGHPSVNNFLALFEIPDIRFLLDFIVENTLNDQHGGVMLTTDGVDEGLRVASKQSSSVYLIGSKLPHKLISSINYTATTEQFRFFRKSIEFFKHQFLGIFFHRLTDSRIDFTHASKRSQEASFDELLHYPSATIRRKLFPSFSKTGYCHSISYLVWPQICLEFMIHVLFPIEIVIIRPQTYLNTNTIRLITVFLPFLVFRKFIENPFRFYLILIPSPCFDYIRPIPESLGNRWKGYSFLLNKAIVR